MECLVKYWRQLFDNILSARNEEELDSLLNFENETTHQRERKKNFFFVGLFISKLYLLTDHFIRFSGSNNIKTCYIISIGNLVDLT